MALASLLLAACTPSPRILLAPDPVRDGTDGTDGPLGVAALERRYEARITDVVPTTLVYPAAADGSLDPTGAPWPAVVWVHGGFVAPERYEWLATHLASRGAVVVMPDSPLELALLAQGNASASLDGLEADAAGDGPLAGAVEAGGPRWIGGHSLGGVTASLEWLDDPRFSGLLLGASYPPASADVAPRAGDPVLALVGSDDGSAEPATVADALEMFDPPVPLGIVDGLNHYGWTDDASPSELAKDGEASRPVDEARQDLLRVLDAWSDAVLAGDVDAAGAIGEEDWPNVDFGEGR